MSPRHVSSLYYRAIYKYKQIVFGCDNGLSNRNSLVFFQNHFLAYGIMLVGIKLPVIIVIVTYGGFSFLIMCFASRCLAMDYSVTLLWLLLYDKGVFVGSKRDFRDHVSYICVFLTVLSCSVLFAR